jgi:hypothetical protein
MSKLMSQLNEKSFDLEVNSIYLCMVVIWYTSFFLSKCNYVSLCFTSRVGSVIEIKIPPLVVDGEYQNLGFAFFTIFPDILFGSQIKSADNRILQEQLESKVSCPLLPTLRPVTTHQERRGDVETHAPSMSCGCCTDCRDQ